MSHGLHPFFSAHPQWSLSEPSSPFTWTCLCQALPHVDGDLSPNGWHILGVSTIHTGVHKTGFPVASPSPHVLSGLTGKTDNQQIVVLHDLGHSHRVGKEFTPCGRSKN